ncbi:MAG: peptidyl-prolyl cis-trans isomerase [Verrucomicrobiae bacterium]|jgi:peptidyl-prolyl cis-trans isomerase SurA|nr:peptidyl-prolyl cis-trans isomerase [Verrucomicrobiae bacterium]
MRIWLITWLLLGSGLLSRAADSPQLLNGIVAIVNDTVITENEAREYIEPVIDFLKERHRNNSGAFQEEAMKAYRDGLNQLIERQLMLDDFKKAGFNLPERFIEDFVQERIREQYGDRSRLIKTLEERGRSYAEFRQEIRDQFIVEQMQNFHISSAIIVSPADIEKYYREHIKDYRLPDQIKLSMIVLNKQEGADNSGIEALATEILKKIRGGADFAEMANIYSEGSQRTEGGDWGWIETKVLREELAKAASLLKAEEVGEVINTPDAAYIMRVDKIRIAYVRPLHEVRAEIEKTLKAEERKRLQDQYVSRLRKKAFIRFF